MDRDQKIEIKKIIQEQISTIQKEVNSLKESSKPVSPDVSLGRLTRQEARLEQEISKKILQNSQSKLTRLKYALGRVDKDEYGICQVCEEDIPYERLKIVPETIICISCANNRSK